MGFVLCTSRCNSECSFVGKGLKLTELPSSESRICSNSLAYSAMDCTQRNHSRKNNVHACMLLIVITHAVELHWYHFKMLLSQYMAYTLIIAVLQHIQ